jgi:hypothetical protein
MNNSEILKIAEERNKEKIKFLKEVLSLIKKETEKGKNKTEIANMMGADLSKISKLTLGYENFIK